MALTLILLLKFTFSLLWVFLFLFLVLYFFVNFFGLMSKKTPHGANPDNSEQTKNSLSIFTAEHSYIFVFTHSNPSSRY